MSATLSRQEMVSEGFVSVANAAKFLSVSRAKVYEMMAAGELAYAKFGKSRRLPLRALNEYAQRAITAGNQAADNPAAA